MFLIIVIDSVMFLNYSSSDLWQNGLNLVKKRYSTFVKEQNLCDHCLASTFCTAPHNSK